VEIDNQLSVSNTRRMKLVQGKLTKYN
jgi:hypothetical protein